ncbi:MAG: ComF family protein [Verrucomicrobiae bacterium]|nr:ComF family protein [Verrucomicrobiae bacterium]
MDSCLAFFYPECCQLCRVEKAGHVEGYVCRTCRNKPGAIRWIQPPICDRCGLPFEGEITTRFDCPNCKNVRLGFSRARAAVVFGGIVLEVVHRYKYKGHTWFEPFLAGLLVEKAGPVLRCEEWDWIVPVPLHPLKMRERDFNQAERLARHLADATGIPLNAEILRKIKQTETQTMLTRSKRAENVRGAFVVRPGAEVGGKRIVLVDDVFTTGATTNECATALKAAGAQDVCVWTLARGL